MPTQHTLRRIITKHFMQWMREAVVAEQTAILFWRAELPRSDILV